MTDDPWEKYRRVTQARIGLARNGHAISTRVLLEFQKAHAMARDAVWTPWRVDLMAHELRENGIASLVLNSAITTREEYLQRPDLGRKLSAESAGRLDAYATSHETDLVFIVSEGLSSRAIEAHFLGFWKEFSKILTTRGFQYGPLVLVEHGRVGISDEIGGRLGAKLAVIFVGERPGLSSPDSMGIYLTYAPRPGNSDAGRNCISNIRPPEGLAYEDAAAKLMFLVQESLRRKLSGIELKEDATLVLKDVSTRRLPK